MALVLLGVGIELVSMLYYIRSTLKGSTRPHPISWAGWTAIGIVGAWAARSGGAGLGFYIAAAFVAVTASIFVISLLPGLGHGMDERSPTDLPVLVLGVLLIALRIAGVGFLRLDDPAVQATLAVLGDSCFAWFTVRKAYQYPDTEPLWPWFGAVIAAAIGIIVLGAYNYTAMAYPMYLLVANAAITGAILIGSSRKRNKRG
jgi:hypothetical protein